MLREVARLLVVAAALVVGGVGGDEDLLVTVEGAALLEEDLPVDMCFICLYLLGTTESRVHLRFD